MCCQTGISCGRSSIFLAQRIPLLAYTLCSIHRIQITPITNLAFASIFPLLDARQNQLATLRGDNYDVYVCIVRISVYYYM